MRGRELTKEEMENPATLFEAGKKLYAHENYFFIYYPSPAQKEVVENEIDYRMDKWDMTVLRWEKDDYLSALIAFLRFVHREEQEGKIPHHLMDCPCTFEDQYMDWVTHGMSYDELKDYIDSLNQLVGLLIYPLVFVSLSVMETYDETERGWEVRKLVTGGISDYPTFFKSIEERKKLNKGGWL